ncbi:unnamed protein product [Mycena citricolor]|uniref:FAD-dependent oxidoreductase 2 FAD-binding domain-containing protein n=1 Tax=Mycena citricolor TaxID=2018698 RepID=A0AAD2HUM6_9AGAR|nr:unnamed protein product [Mycena citricolor]
MAMKPTIVIGGGLAGLSAAHTLLERGQTVLLLDKKPSLGGNSVKASSGINGVYTKAQKDAGVVDSVDAFAADTTTSAGSLAQPDLIAALTGSSAAAISWLTDTFGVDLSIVARLGGQSAARTHRDKGGAPGYAITGALMKALEAAGAAKVTIVKNARVVKLVESSDRVVGVEYEVGGETKTAEGSGVILATGGYAASFSPGSLLATHRPDLLALSTTNGDHATGDGIALATSLAALPAGTIHLDQVQVHPTGFVDPKDPGARTKFLAAEALRGAGGLLIDKDGRRFVDEMEKRDVVTAAMQRIEQAGQGPIRLLLGVGAAAEVKKHCKRLLCLQRPDEAVSERGKLLAGHGGTVGKSARYLRGTRNRKRSFRQNRVPQRKLQRRRSTPRRDHHASRTLHHGRAGRRLRGPRVVGQGPGAYPRPLGGGRSHRRRPRQQPTRGIVSARGCRVRPDRRPVCVRAARSTCGAGWVRRTEEAAGIVWGDAVTANGQHIISSMSSYSRQLCFHPD